MMSCLSENSALQTIRELRLIAKKTSFFAVLVLPMPEKVRGPLKTLLS